MQSSLQQSQQNSREILKTLFQQLWLRVDDSTSLFTHIRAFFYMVLRVSIEFSCVVQNVQAICLSV